MYFKFPLYSLFILILVVSCAEEKPVAEEKILLRFKKSIQYKPFGRGTIIENGYQFLYTDGEDIYRIPLDSLGLRKFQW